MQTKGSRAGKLASVSRHDIAPRPRLATTVPSEDAMIGFAGEVIRQLCAGNGHDRSMADEPSEAELEEFCNTLISQDDSASSEIIKRVCADGVSAEKICLGYLDAAARMLGRWWIEDRTDFVEVTVGANRLLGILRKIRRDRERMPRPKEAPLIFAALPGEQHVLGVSIAAELFRQDGWNVLLEVGLSHDELVAFIERSPGSIVGLSLCGFHSFGALSRLVGALRIRCPDNPVVVSGHGVSCLKPHLALMGVDGIAPDIDEAKQVVSALWDRTMEEGGANGASVLPESDLSDLAEAELKTG